MTSEASGQMTSAAKTVLHDNELKLKQVARNFRSDTFTIQTPDMFLAMAAASRGDDMVEEDTTTNDFQDRIAKMTGKEASLFCVSGTMTNQIALRTHLIQPPHAVLCDHRAHVHVYEAGGIAYHSQAQTIPVIPSNGWYLRWEEDILPRLVLDDSNIHFCPTRVIELENTLGGMVFPQEEVLKISEEAHKLGIMMHMDGARIWETSAGTGLSLEELCRPFDSISLCLSKGIGAPIGSILVGSKRFIYKAMRFRKLFGGAIRQSGCIVGAAEYALDTHFPLLKKAHQLSQRLALGMAEIGAKILSPTQTNMVWFDPASLGFSVDEFGRRAKQLPNPLLLGGERLVLHHQTSTEAVDDLLRLLQEMKEENKHNGKSLSDTERRESIGFAHGEYFPLLTNGHQEPGRGA